MKSDTVIKNEGIKILTEKLGKFDTERFISLLLKEPFDYTLWQQENLNDEELSIKEYSKKAMNYCRKNKN
ncbi:MAG: hypothetical protein WC337_11760 [Candidatus Muiribacteriota bacterium]